MRTVAGLLGLGLAAWLATASAPADAKVCKDAVSAKARSAAQLSDASREKISARAEKLLRIFERLTAIEIIVDLTDSTRPRVDAKVSAEHKHDFVAHHQSDNLMGSVDVVVHRLEQQLRKYKEKVVERHRNSDPRRRIEMLKPEKEVE